MTPLYFLFRDTYKEVPETEEESEMITVPWWVAVLVLWLWPGIFMALSDIVMVYRKAYRARVTFMTIVRQEDDADTFETDTGNFFAYVASIVVFVIAGPITFFLR